MKHGFMSRGDTRTNPAIARAVKTGMTVALSFFKKHL